MDSSKSQWVLAFDASCATCREVSHAVAQACDGRLKVSPLADERVQAWRNQALGEQAQWEPVLFKVTDTGVRAWTGRAMGLALVRCLGPVSTARVLVALGRLRNGESQPSEGQAGMGRAQFLRFGAGAALALGLVAAGRMPAFAADGSAAVDAWLRKNKDQLSYRYDDVVAHPLQYRRAIFRESTPAVRSQLWTQQLTRYRAAHPELTAGQTDVLDQALKLASDESTFAMDGAGQPEVHQRFADLQTSAIREFGQDSTYALFAMLGPDSESYTSRTLMGTQLADCGCSKDSPLCGRGQQCWDPHGCNYRTGCGWFWRYGCDGVCV